MAEDEDETLASDLQLLMLRGYGIDLQFRRGGTNWPRWWRGQMVWSKNQRSEYRVVEYGDTVHEVVRQLMRRMIELDERG